MSYEITKKTIEETPFLFVERKVKLSEISEGMGAMFGAVYQYATSNGIAFAGCPLARYPDFCPDLITIQAGMPIVGECEGEGEIQVGALPGGPVASTIHQGPYDNLPQAHAAMKQWLEENSEEAGCAPWEVYLTDPSAVPNPADWKTEVVWPLK